MDTSQAIAGTLEEETLIALLSLLFEVVATSPPLINRLWCVATRRFHLNSPCLTTPELAPLVIAINSPGTSSLTSSAPPLLRWSRRPPSRRRCVARQQCCHGTR